MVVTRSTLKRPASPSQTDQASPAKKVMVDVTKENTAATTAKTKVLRSTRSSRCSSAFLYRWLDGRKPGTGMILDLPTEVVENIASFLPLDAFGKFRLTCKDIDHRTLECFGKRFFTSKNFLPSRYGLEALVAISQSRLSQYVQTLGLGPPCQDNGESSLGCHKEIEKLSPGQKDQIQSKLYDFAEDNHLMRLLGEDAAMIGAALRNMRSVTTLKFLDEGFFDLCKSFGVSQFYKDSGTTAKPHFYHENLDSLQSMARLFINTIRAAETAGLQLECIDAALTRETGSDLDWDIPCRFGAYNTPIKFESIISSREPHPPIFSNLRKLQIPINPADLTAGVWSEESKKARQKRYVQSLVNFLSKMPRLEHLGLFSGCNLEAYDMVKAILTTANLTHLKSFELAYMSIYVCAHKLIAALEPLSRVERLRLYEVGTGLGRSGWDTALTWISENMAALKCLDLETEMWEDDDEYPLIYVNAESNELFKEELDAEMMMWLYPEDFDEDFDEDSEGGDPEDEDPEEEDSELRDTEHEDSGHAHADDGNSEGGDADDGNSGDGDSEHGDAEDVDCGGGDSGVGDADDGNSELWETEHEESEHGDPGDGHSD